MPKAAANEKEMNYGQIYPLDFISQQLGVPEHSYQVCHEIRVGARVGTASKH